MGGLGAAGVEGGKKMRGGMLSAFGGLGGQLLVAGGITAAIAGMKKSIESLARIEVINTQTETVIKSMGNAAGVSAKHVEDLAGSLENLTATEAESIQEGANLLLTFGNIRNTVGAGNDIFDQTVTLMTDLGRAMGQDSKTSAIQLGKALNDPIKGMTALSRVGVSFTAEEKERIKTLQESGDMMGAQKVILAALQSQFGGSGAAYASTFAGTIDLVKHSLGTIGETIMGTAMPGLKTFAEKGLSFLQGFADKLPAMMAGIGDFLGPLFSMAQPIFAGIWSIIEPLIPQIMVLAQAFNPLMAVFQALAPLIPPFLEQMGPVFTSVLNAIVPLVVTLGQIFAEVLVVAFQAIVPVLMEVITAIATALVPIMDQLAPLLVMVAQFIGDLVIQLMPLISAILQLAVPLIQMLAPIISIIISLFQMLLPPIMVIIQVLMAVLIPVIGLVVGVLRVLMTAFSFLFQIVAPIIQLIGNAVMWLWSTVFKPVFGFIMGIIKLVGDVWDNTFGKMIKFLQDNFPRIIGIIKAPINGLIGLLNMMIDALNSIRLDIPDWVPFIGGQSWKLNIPRIPALAEGGYVDSPTTALIGEAGPEVVTPLADFERMMGLEKDQTAKGQTINYYAAPNQSLDAEQQLFTAMKRAKVIAGW
jgi:phage-related protein